jgi:quinol monooxygenase YgiN
MAGKKYVVGWLRFKPGRRDAFIQASREYVETCRKERGCEFFEFSLSPFEPDIAMVMECFSSREIHEGEHLKTVHFEAFWKRLSDACIDARFLNILSDTVIPDSAKFD